MKDLKDIKSSLKLLESKGFRLIHGNGSRLKIFPPNKDLPFYTAHVNDKCYHPLRRFAASNWQIEL